MTFWLLPCVIRKIILKMKISPLIRAVLHLTPQTNPKLVQRQFPTVLEQGTVAAFIAGSQPNGLKCLVIVGNCDLSLTTLNCGVFQSVFG